jgi:glycosyltransferase involved in cell wall biosynthesis
VDWLSGESKPDVVHLSNILLIGVAREIKKALGVPIYCSLQDEDSWLEAMGKSAQKTCREIIADRSRNVAAFVAVSDDYRNRMQKTFGLPPEKMRTVYVGVTPGDYPTAPLDFNPPTIGFLSRMSTALGAGVITDAFLILKQKPEHRRLRLRLSGGATEDDKKSLARIREKLAQRNLLGDVDFIPEFDKAKRIQFLQTLSVMCVPSQEPLAIGVFALEAMASGIPVVVANIGAFPELIQATGGGILYEPNDAATLAGVLDNMLRNPARTKELGQAGRRTIAEKFSNQSAAKSMTSVYSELR